MQSVFLFHPAKQMCVQILPSERCFLMLFWWAVPFCISGALHHLWVNVSFKGGCSIYVNGLLGLIVCWAIQRQFFMRLLGREPVWAPNTVTHKNKHTHTRLSGCLSVYTQRPMEVIGRFEKLWVDQTKCSFMGREEISQTGYSAIKAPGFWVSVQTTEREEVKKVNNKWQIDSIHQYYYNWLYDFRAGH